MNMNNYINKDEELKRALELGDDERADILLDELNAIAKEILNNSIESFILEQYILTQAMSVLEKLEG